MSDDRERAELLAALHAAGAASDEDDAELQALREADPSVEELVSEFRDSIVALASSVEPIETSPKTLAKIQKKIEGDQGGFLGRLRRWFSNTVPWVLCAVFVQCTYLHDGVSASDTAPDGAVRSCVDVRTEADPAVRSTLASARLTVYVSPSGNVWINGTARGTAPLRNVTLKPGHYEVSAGQGSPTETRPIHLRPGQRRTLRFDLTPGE